MDQYTVDREKVKEPRITLTEEAFSQISLILENDFTLTGNFFRIKIDSKGCAGFKYATGFSKPNKDDFKLEILGLSKKSITILMDPFTATYLQTAVVNYIQDYENDEEGFTIISNDSSKFQGKFWNKNPELNPPIKE